jgi:hypothetical protein
LFYTIYKTTNKLNGKHYIGAHKTNILDDDYMGSGLLLTRAIEKYGLENFEKQILHIFDTPEEMWDKEAELVIIGEDSYNIKVGGCGGFDYININGKNIYFNHKETTIKNFKNSGIHKHLENLKTDINYRNEWIKKISESKKGNKNWVGKKHSKETKMKMSEDRRRIGFQKGEKNSQFGKCWITNGIENISIKKDDLDIWLEKGYYKGRV